MGKIYEGIDENLTRFITTQHVFFVATAPLDGSGHINLSPKGLDSFHVLDSKTVAYLDLTGSGIETTAHLRENGRIVLVFCALEGPPRILRLHGRGEVVEPGDPRSEALLALFPRFESARSVILIALERIADSCGYGVPRYRYEGQRTQLADWARRKGPEGIVQYRAEKNAASIDGLPGLRSAATETIDDRSE